MAIRSSTGLRCLAIVAASLLAGCSSCDCVAESDWVVGELAAVSEVVAVEVTTTAEQADGARRLTLRRLADPVSFPPGGPTVVDEGVETLTVVQDAMARRLQTGERATIAVGVGSQTTVVLPDGEVPRWWSSPDLLERVIREAAEIDGGEPTDVLITLIGQARYGGDVELLTEAMRDARVDGASTGATGD